MKRFTFAALAAMFVALFTFAAPAQARKVFSHKYGQWELMAWNGNNQFCALKTYWNDGRTLSLRKTSHGGLELVVFDPNFWPDRTLTTMNVWFDGQWFGSATAVTYSSAPNQVFLQIGHNALFMEAFQAGHNMVIQSENVSWDLGLVGTRHLGNYLNSCVREFGF